MYDSASTTSDEARTIQILPSAPLSLFRRKLTKLLGLPAAAAGGMEVWTTRPGSRDRATRVDMDGQGEAGTVGWWFVHGEGVVVETRR